MDRVLQKTKRVALVAHDNKKSVVPPRGVGSSTERWA